MKIFFGVLAGGSGQRLWPLSTPEHPKQFIPFIGNKSLLALTLDRLRLFAGSSNEIFIVTSSFLYKKTKEYAGDTTSFIIEEPSGRNTAPAILLSCLRLHELEPNSIVGFFPADHFIPDTNAFCSIIERAAAHAKNSEDIVTLGLKPMYPATGYGYIEANVRDPHGEYFYSATKFHEKPSLALAKQYLTQNNIYWNTGMFLAKTSVLLKAFKKHTPKLWEDMNSFLQGDCSYTDLENISFDYAIMEKHDDVVVFPSDFGWYDVGNLSVFLKLQQSYQGKNKRQEVINVDAHDNLVYSNKKTVACVGVSNLCIIDTGDTLLVVSAKESERVKEALSAKRI